MIKNKISLNEMSKNSKVNLIASLVSGSVALVSLLSSNNTINNEIIRNVLGVAFTLGTIGFLVSLGNLCNIRYYKKLDSIIVPTPLSAQKNHPVNLGQDNSKVLQMVKSKPSNIVNILAIVLAYVAIIFNAPLWCPLALVGIFLSKYLLEIALTSKYKCI